MREEARQSFDKLLAAAHASKRLEDFLAAVADCIYHRDPERESKLILFWEKYQGVFERANAVDDFSRFLRDHACRIQIRPPGKPPSKAPEEAETRADTAQPSSPEFKQALKGMEEYTKSVEERTRIHNDLLKTSFARYRNFPAIFQVHPFWAEYLSVFDPSFDPCAALSEIFGSYYGDEFEGLERIHNREKTFPVSPDLYLLIRNISEMVKTQATQDEASILDRIVTRSELISTQENVACFRTAATTIQSLFEAYVVTFDHFESPTSEELEILFLLPFSSHPKENGKPHCNFKLVAWLCDSPDSPGRCETRFDEYIHAAKDMFNHMRTARQREYGGKSPYTASSANSIRAFVSCYADVSGGGELSRARDIIGLDEPFVWSNIVYDDILSLEGTSNLEWLSEDVDDYLTVVDSLAECDEVEAAQFLLAFVLFRLVKTMAGNLEPLPQLLRRLGSSLYALPHSNGAQALTKAIGFAQEEASKAGQAITAQKLHQFQARSFLDMLIEKGESETVEFKETLRVNTHTGKNDRRMEHAVLKTMAAFLNSKGGSLVIGVDDVGKPKGLQADNFKSIDKWQQHLINIVGRSLEGVLPGTWNISLHKLEGHDVAIVQCDKSSVAIFVQDSTEEQFFVRDGPTTRELGMRDGINYIRKNFTRD